MDNKRIWLHAGSYFFDRADHDFFLHFGDVGVDSMVVFMEEYLTKDGRGYTLNISI